jgi:hypothetical protein
LLIERVSGLVHSGKESGCEPPSIEAGGDAHITRTKGYTERMDGTILAASLPVVAEVRDHAPSELLLLGLVERSAE